ALVYALVATGEQQQPGQLRELAHFRLRKAIAICGQIDRATTSREARFRGTNRATRRLDLEHHPGTTSIGAVIYRAMRVGRKVPRTRRLHGDLTALDGAPKHSEANGFGDELREQRHHLDAHARELRLPVRRPIEDDVAVFQVDLENPVLHERNPMFPLSAHDDDVAAR